MGPALSVTVSKYYISAKMGSSADVNTFAHSFHYRENMGVDGGREGSVCGCVCYGAVSALPQGGRTTHICYS